jgi:hypothetical protein
LRWPEWKRVVMGMIKTGVAAVSTSVVLRAADRQGLLQACVERAWRAALRSSGTLLCKRAFRTSTTRDCSSTSRGCAPFHPFYSQGRGLQVSDAQEEEQVVEVMQEADTDQRVGRLEVYDSETERADAALCVRVMPMSALCAEEAREAEAEEGGEDGDGEIEAETVRDDPSYAATCTEEARCRDR